MPRISAISPDAMPSPRASPSTVPTAPMTSASSSTDAVAMPPRRAERAEHAELAHALEHRHVEAVQDQEAADEQRHAREEVEDHVQRLRAARPIWSENSPGVCTSAPAPSDALDALLERLGLAAVVRHDG